MCGRRSAPNCLIRRLISAALRLTFVMSSMRPGVFRVSSFIDLGIHPQITQITQTKPKRTSHEKAQEAQKEGKTKNGTPIPGYASTYSFGFPLCAFLCFLWLCFHLGIHPQITQITQKRRSGHGTGGRGDAEKTTHDCEFPASPHLRVSVSHDFLPSAFCSA